MYIVASTGLNSVVQLITLIIIFCLILFLCYWTTRFIGGYQKSALKSTNFEVIEAFRISNTKFIQIIRIGEKYLVISVCKDSINLLTELSKDEVVIQEKKEDISFSKILEKVNYKGRQGSSNDKEDDN
ncbi:MAG: flagellar biosynthetic protein FliO [Lachnospiraceae bacterium]|nr:flagellar biosynthetic protein FliO [Lachnospiraceae bacterium]